MDLSFKENFITTKDAGVYSGYTPDYIARLIRSGKIVGQKIGHSWFVNRDSFDQFLADKNKQQKDTTPSPAPAPMPVVVPALESEILPSVSPNAEKIRNKIQELTSAAKPVAVSSFSSPEVLVEQGFLKHFSAFSIALLVVAFGALGAQAITSSHVVDRVAAVAEQAAEGFAMAFGTLPSRVIANIAATDAARNALASAAESVSPLPTATALPQVTIALPQSLPIEAHGTLAPALPSMPHGVAVRGALPPLSSLPSLLAGMVVALGQGVAHLTHLAIGADVSFAYGVATVAPQSSRVATVFLLDTGTVLMGSVASVPQLAVRTYRYLATAPVLLAPALAEAVLKTEYVGISHVVALATAGRAAYADAGGALASVQSAVERTFGFSPLVAK